MNIDELVKRIEKLEFHTKLLNESLHTSESPMASLAIAFGWSKSEFDVVFEIFGKFDQQLSNNEEINWSGFEREFDEKLHISCQDLKSIILAFYRNERYVNVCYAYVSSLGETLPVEFQ